MSYSPQLLHDKVAASLAELASARKFLIGLSGGLDSVALLHVLVQLRDERGADLQLRAIHINHQLQEQAESWGRHCQALCDELGVSCTLARVTIDDASGIENAARQARYREFEAALSADEELLLAHHRDDQLETILLRLNRGSGSRGLAGIPRSRALGASKLLRPLLTIDRAELQRYAESMKLSWVEDQSNEDLSFDRNYSRHKVLPLIEARWPGYRQSWSKSAILALESEALNQDLAAIDLQLVATESVSAISRVKLLSLSEPRRRNVLRYWLARGGAAELGWNQLQQLSNEVLQASNAEFVGPDFRIFCFRGCVHLLDAQRLEQGMADVALGAPTDLIANGDVPLTDNGLLRFRAAQGSGICTAKINKLEIRYRRGGETCRLEGRPSKSLKKILQETDTPPWLRSRMPLIYSGEDLACIPGVGVSAQFAVKAGEPGCEIEWQQPELSFSR